MKPEKQPTWILSPEWAIGINKLNWILYQGKCDKHGIASGYKVVGYYPTAIMLFESLLNKITRTESGEPDVIAHIQHALRTATSAYSAFSELIDALPYVPREVAVGVAESQQEAA